MWYASWMERHPLEPALKEALAAVRHAKDTREYHARRTPKGTPQREEDLSMARHRLAVAMTPIRSFLGAAPFKLKPGEEEIWERANTASKAIQYERRQLWKMQR